jgi:hypothetical protein
MAERIVAPATPVKLEQAMQTVTQEIEGAYTPALLRGVAYFESRFKAFATPE